MAALIQLLAALFKMFPALRDIILAGVKAYDKWAEAKNLAEAGQRRNARVAERDAFMQRVSEGEAGSAGLHRATPETRPSNKGEPGVS